MLTLAAAVRDLLVPFIAGSGVLLAVLLALLVGQRLWRRARDARAARLQALYVPLVDAVLADAPDGEAFARLGRAASRHRDAVAAAIIARLHLLQGAVVDRSRDVAAELGLVSYWLARLGHRAWWARAEAALALGLVRTPDAVDALVVALDDDHDEVRAAAVDALGRIADPRAVPALLARLANQSRHQRTRIVEALRAFGGTISAPLIAHAETAVDDRALVADVLALVGSADARDALLAWATGPDAATRAAAWRALAAIGLDDRAYYHALRALTDVVPEVRAGAARALGRSGRGEAAPYLAARLDDQWEVAAQSGRALKQLGSPGLVELRKRLSHDKEGLGRDLAKQLVWEAGKL